MKKRYIQRYANAYALPSPRAKELMGLFWNTCRQHGLLCTPEDCFAYLNVFPEPFEQTSLF